MGEAEAVAAIEETGEGCAPERGAVAPWLVKEYHVHDEEDSHITETNYSLHNIFKPNNENCREIIPELTNTTFYQKPSHQGWVIIVCTDKEYDYTLSNRNFGDCFLWNPGTKETIQLPSLINFYKGNSYFGFCDIVLSSPPRTAANISLDNVNNDSMVILFCWNHNEEHENHDEEDDDDEDEAHDYGFLFCRPGEKQWRIHTLSPDMADLIWQRRPQSIHCFKGKLYLMCSDNDYNNVDQHPYYHLEIEQIIKDTDDLTISVKSFEVKKEVLFPLIFERAFTEPRYVESHEDLFRVDEIHRCGIHEIISIEVARLNFSSMEWEKVNSLGDHVLFFGNHTTACCSAADLGFTKGCLYCCSWHEKGLHKIEVESAGNTLMSREFSCTNWVTMPFNQQRRVENMLGSKEEENGILLVSKTKTSTTMVVNDEGNTGEREVAKYWDNLNKDILGLIANHLYGSDYKFFRSVCKENRAIIPKVQETSYLSPWLVFSTDHNYTIFSVVNPMYKDEKYFINLPDLADCTIRFQKGGWLLMTRKHNIFFYNPFTRETIKLPDIDSDYCYPVFCVSSLPTSSDCIIFVMDESTNQVCIDLIRRGESQWSSHKFNNTHPMYESFHSTAFFRYGDFFCVDSRGIMGVFSPEDNSWKILEEPHEQTTFHTRPGFLVECGGDILLVILEGRGRSIRISRLNFSQMEWEEVESLEEYVLFVSHTSCVSAVAPNNYMKNKVYFPRLHLNDGGILFYSLETYSYHSYESQHPANNTKGWFRNCTWIEPNRSVSTAEELDWLKKPF